MDVDKMFKLPSLPASAGQKRKMPDAPTPEMLKKYRQTESEPSSAPHPLPTNGKGKGRAATVEEDEGDYDNAADRDVYDGEEDDEGRFFGGGLNNEQQQILDIFDKAGDGEDGPTLDLPGLRRQLGKFERIVTKNAEMRGKFPDDPSKFIDSESDLDGALKQFLPLTQNPPLFFPELVKSGVVALLTNLLSHENTDIAIDVIEVVRELTDEDVGAEVDDFDEEDNEGTSAESSGRAYKTRLAMGELIDELLNNSLLDLLVSNLSRLDEEEETDSQGVFHILGVFENLLSFMPPLAEQIVSDTNLLPWLLKRIQQKEYDSNKQYASEILAILLQDNRDIILKVGEMNGMDILLQGLSQYRKKDPGDSEEVEYMENLFDIVCSLLSQPEMKKAFVDNEGVELMVLMMKEKLLAKTRSIKVLNYALQTEDGSEGCEKFVQALGLKTFFSAFMGKGEGKKKKLNATSSFEDEEHLLGILVSLFTNLASDTPERIRLIAKFVENGYEKVDRLLEMREVAENKLKSVEKEINMEKRVMQANKEEITDIEETEWYLRRIDSGLSSLQNADYILAWMCMEDDGAMTHARVLLARKDQSFKSVVAVLSEFKDNIGDDEEEEEEQGTMENVQKMILNQLIAFIQGLE
ncbi:uncharacterized protein I303_100304 [Kwoniella dejecticola CBS 10117]|uniref:Beta-catenin-like protein 1 n=1 Tax=Kwoniella dejecticola CBS 10117 TaxID=1296121 RepID=A0A1A6AEI5_9TREE|nr:beta-catenin-like protein 1 [Kwoniella dejecticola CBS 10117]OBR88487.1 beta-catenin-like protein 1 [Kwoniella dejecticola CBS 10117]